MQRSVFSVLVFVSIVLFLSFSFGASLNSCADVELNVISSAVNQKTVVGVKCEAGEAIQMFFFNSNGDVLLGPIDIVCSAGELKQETFVPLEKGLYGVKVFKDDCVIERYFSPTAKESISVPDGNFLSFGIVLIIVVFVVFGNSKKK